MALDIYINPVTGGYELRNNKFTYVDVTVNKINVLLNMKIGSYIYASTYGNPLLSSTGLLSLSEISQGINTCLQPLLQLQEITNVVIKDIQITPTNRYIINIGITLPNGNQPLITWTK